MAAHPLPRRIDGGQIVPVVRAGPNQYLLTGRDGKLENRGSAVQLWLRPGSIFVLVPSTRQEAAFEFTQETKDGIPLRFKGIIIYRITDPIAAAREFDFTDAAGVARISSMLTHVCLGELRHAVSHMTMTQCIEERKTTLSGVAEAALEAAVRDGDGGPGDWGITVEVAQLAQVFIVDPGLRAQLEAEVRNEIKVKSDGSDVRAVEETRLAQMASDGRVQERTLAGDRERIRREEELELAELARRRRRSAEELATARQELGLEQERFRAQMDADQDRLAAESPVRLARIAQEREILERELVLLDLRNRAKALEVEHELLLPRERQAMRREILPIEQAPAIVESASRVLQGTTIYGENAQLVGQLAPVLEILGRAVRQATAGSVPPEPEPVEMG